MMGSRCASTRRTLWRAISKHECQLKPIFLVLHELWLHEEGAVDFSIDPGDALLGLAESKSGNHSRRCIHGQGEVVGYARVNGAKARYFLARDGETAQQMARQIGAEVELPLHPYSASVQSPRDARARCVGRRDGLPVCAESL